MKAVVAAFNQEKALVGAFSVIVKPVVEPMDCFTALVKTPVFRRSVETIQGLISSERMDLVRMTELSPLDDETYGPVLPEDHPPLPQC